MASSSCITIPAFGYHVTIYKLGRGAALSFVGQKLKKNIKLKLFPRNLSRNRGATDQPVQRLNLRLFKQGSHDQLTYLNIRLSLISQTTALRNCY
jgi:hypothetical protein